MVQNVRTVPRWLLAAISCLSPFGLTIIAPLIPLLSIKLDASAADLQYLISAYVLGLALTQPIVGLVSDHYGRRPVLLTGFALFFLATLALTREQSLNWMIVLRFFQAVGVSVGTVVARGLIRDLLPAQEALKAFALISGAMGFSPIVAPVAAGLIATQFGVSSVFWMLAGLGVGLWLWCFQAIPETRLRVDHPFLWRNLGSTYALLLSSSQFWGFAGAYGFLQGLFFSLLGVGAILFWEQFGIGVTGFSLLWSSLACVYILGSLALHRFAYLTKPDTQLMVVKWLCLVSLAAPAVVWLWGLNVLTLLTPLACMMFISGILTPSVMLGAVNVYPELSGTAAGLSSAIGMGAGAMFTVVGGQAYEVSPFLLVVLMGLSGLGAGFAWHWAHRT